MLVVYDLVGRNKAKAMSDSWNYCVVRASTAKESAQYDV
jgi:hypothetical protein